MFILKVKWQTGIELDNMVGPNILFLDFLDQCFSRFLRLKSNCDIAGNHFNDFVELVFFQGMSLGLHVIDEPVVFHVDFGVFSEILGVVDDFFKNFKVFFLKEEIVSGNNFAFTIV